MRRQLRSPEKIPQHSFSDILSNIFNGAKTKNQSSEHIKIAEYASFMDR